MQASRNELVQADPVALQKEVNRLTALLADLRGSASAAALAVIQAELAAATVAGGCLAEELTAAEHACRSTQVAPRPRHLLFTESAHVLLAGFFVRLID